MYKKNYLLIDSNHIDIKLKIITQIIYIIVSVSTYFKNYKIKPTQLTQVLLLLWKIIKTLF